MSVVTGHDIWREYERLKGIIGELESELMASTAVLAESIRAYRDGKAAAWLVFADEKSAAARRDATDNHVSHLKGAMEAAEVMHNTIRERVWNTRAQLGLIDDVAGVVRSEIRMGGQG